jgi:hypothetical protein
VELKDKMDYSSSFEVFVSVEKLISTIDDWVEENLNIPAYKNIVNECEE